MEEEYIQNLKNYLVEFDKLPIAKKKITALLEVDNCYKKGNKQAQYDTSGCDAIIAKLALVK